MTQSNGALPDATRDDGRGELRDPVRLRPREPHEKYDLDPSQMKRDQSYVWVATKIRGAPNPRLGQYMRAGYRPCRAADHPELSDFGLYDQTLVDMGVVQQINADSPVVLDDQMLVSRPKHLTAQAVKQTEQAAEQQYNDHLRRIREKSEREVGKATRISRRYGPADIVPDDGDLEAR
jgi:hypothetical protein